MSQVTQLLMLIGLVAWILSLFVGFSLRPLLRLAGSIAIGIGIFFGVLVARLLMLVGVIFVAFLLWVAYHIITGIFGHPHRRR